MKIKLSNILFVLLCIVLLAASVCMGVVRGWSRERSGILSALAENGDLRIQLESRGMDAANLASVASRHLPTDHADLLALLNASGTLLGDYSDVHEILVADASITMIARRFSQELPALPSVQACTRDQTYICTLTELLGNRDDLANSYVQMINDFNQRMSASPTGRLALFFGVELLPSTQD